MKNVRYGTGQRMMLMLSAINLNVKSSSGTTCSRRCSSAAAAVVAAVAVALIALTAN